MRKRIFGKRFKRDTNARKALFRSLMHSLVLYGKIRTSEAKAKAIKGEIEKLVTHAKNKGEEARSILSSRLANEKVVDKIIKEIAPLFAARSGGYTRILKLGPRLKDGAKMVRLAFVDEVKPTSFAEPKRKDSIRKPQNAKSEKREDSGKNSARMKKSSSNKGKSRSAKR